MKKLLLVFCCLLPLSLFGQLRVSGTILNAENEALFGANIYLISQPKQGAISDLKGQFSLNLSSLSDSLRVVFIGYQEKSLAMEGRDLSKPLLIRLEKKDWSIEAVEITAPDPITNQFSTIAMNKMDIYLNPLSPGDPLNAITALPSSTTIDDSANPSLRGSAADRSRVIVNGVPIYNPVRASQLNNQGFFSLFNPEVMEKQYVYASNPPLTYGNTSAGLVDLQLLRTAPNTQLQVSGGLASMGFLMTQPLKGKKNFLQAYGNYQFSEAFIRLNQPNMPRLKRFNTKDIGLHITSALGKRTAFRSFNYGIDEGYAYLTD